MAYFPVDPTALSIVQVAVPSYALRLTRAFGARRVGWSLVGVFVCLALLNLVNWFTPYGSEVQANIIALFIVVPLLLLIGLSHVESLTRQHQRLERAELEKQWLRESFERKLDQSTTSLTATIEKLEGAIGAQSQTEASLKEAQEQWRLLFVKNPLAMWVFDLRSLGILAVNEAALRTHGYDESEFMSLTAGLLCVPGQVDAFLKDTQTPCSGPQPRGIWLHRRKDGLMLGVELMAADLRYGGYPARLIVARPVYKEDAPAASS